MSGLPTAAAALRDAVSLGGFFALDLDPTGPQWLPYPGDIDGRLRPADLAADRRAAASCDFLALAARCVSPLLAAAVRSGVVPVLHAQRLVVHAGTRAVGLRGPVDPLAEGGFAAVVQDVLAPAVATYAARFRIPERVLWGNAASALAGAAVVLADERAERIVRSVLVEGRLADTGAYEASGRFRRRSCCLYYKLPGGGLCGDCVLAGA